VGRLPRGFDLAAALGGGRLATADPDSVRAGEYARAALTYVARGEAPLGIVYQTDALAEKRVRVVGVFPEGSHPPIMYPVALTVRAPPEATRLADFLTGESARQIFTRYGFTALAASPPDLHRPGATAALTEPPQRGAPAP
jgi:molybdate transport system substrate-binding protein